MKRLSVVIIARNEEANLPRCLDALKWAGEIVLVDSGSTGAWPTSRLMQVMR